ncbi:MAG: hypothetical protein LBN09_02105 [Clostridioides sp.]|nr:hypothetical protein [Clostridioides sp.]
MLHLYEKLVGVEAFEKYKKLLQNRKRTRKIMFLVGKTRSIFTYRDKLESDYGEEPNITTYIGFIKKELIKYWPIVLKECNLIEKKDVSPTFISNELSMYILQSRVGEKREIEGYFSDITATDKNIANSIRNNIDRAVENRIDIAEIGNMIYSSKKNKDSLSEDSYMQMDILIDYYTRTLLKYSVLDNSMCIYLYNEYLLRDEWYFGKLCEEVDCLIIDSLELCSNAQVDFISALEEADKEILIYYDFKRDCSSFSNIDLAYIENKIISKECDVVKPVKLANLYGLDLEVEIDDSNQLYGDMLGGVVEKISELVETGVELKDIVVISHTVEPSIINKLSKNLEARGISVLTTNPIERTIDNEYANAMTVACSLFYNQCKYIREEEFVNFIKLTLEVNQISARKIAGGKREELKGIMSYITSKRDEDVQAHEFLIKFYTDILLPLKDGIENFKMCKQIVYDAKNLTDQIHKLGLDEKRSKEEIFLDILKKNPNVYHSFSDLEEIIDGQGLILTTPNRYIPLDMDRSVQLWVDIGSNMWSMKIEREISNPVLFRSSYTYGNVFTKERENSYRSYYLLNTIYNILEKADKVYCFKSEYSVNGYVQESQLYSILEKLKGEFNQGDGR